MHKKKVTSLIPTDLVGEYAEIGADKLAEEAKQYVSILEPLGEETPYVKTLVAAIKLPRTISDFILGKKVYSFLYSSGLSDEKISKFEKKFSKVEQDRLWEQIVFAINMHDNMIKTEIVGKLFDALIRDEINNIEFSSMVHATNSIDTNALIGLKAYYSLSDQNSLTASQIYSFISLGLISIDNSGIGTLGGGGPIHPLNQLGWKYVGIVYDYPDSEIAGIKIGKEVLFAAYNPETQQPTGKAYPLSYIKDKELMYEEVDVFVVNEKKEVLCESSGLPHVLGSKAAPAGLSLDVVAHQIAEPYGQRIHAILGRKIPGLNIKKSAYILKHSKSIEGLVFKDVNLIDETFNSYSPEDERIRYLVAFNEQMKRYVSGELDEFWDRF